MMDAKEDLKKIRLTVLEMAHGAGEGHVPSSFSVLELLYAIYSKKEKEDSFFLSKGHASAGLYAILAHFNLISGESLASYCKYDSKLGGHPHRESNIVMCSSGSLGHGFPISAGYALSKKIKKEKGRVFCLVGDGETNEGAIWETAMYAEQLKLDNLVCIVDKNNSQTRAMTSINLEEKFKAFGWRVKVIPGHDIKEIEDALFGAESDSDKPYCIIAETVKGKGVKEMEDHIFEWHHRSPSDKEFEQFKEEILAS